MPLLLAALLAAAGTAAGETVDHAGQYRACLALATRDAAAALGSAAAWHEQGGGSGAAHCRAVALVQLERYDEAAAALEALAAALPPDAAVRPDTVLAQAANAWLLAGRPEAAVMDLDAALRLAPGRPDLLVDRARAQAAAGAYGKALADLDAAVLADVEGADPHAFRAAALRRLGRMDEATDAVAVALELEPANPLALLERGLLHALAGAEPAARADFEAVRRHHPGTPAADAAGGYLSQLGGG